MLSSAPQNPKNVTKEKVSKTTMRVFTSKFTTTANSNADCINLSIDRELIYGMVQQKQFAEMWKSLGHQGAQVHVLRSLEKSIKFTRDLSMNPNGKYHVLTTGSVHLVGRALGILEGVESL